MAAITKKRLYDDILNILTRFGRTDDSRFDETWISNKIDQIRAQMIIAEYQENQIIDQTWLTDLGLWIFNPVNFADDPSVNYCQSDISKAFIPNVVSITSKRDSDVDLGIYALISACGTKEYTPFPISLWQHIPSEHVRSRFSYYQRINTAIYVNKKVDKLRILAVLASPEDGYIINSAPVLSGSIVSGIVYKVKGGTVIYNNIVRLENTTFTGTATTTFTGDGKVFLNSQLLALSETQPYPVSADMARMITLEICTKEFSIEAGNVVDIYNDSADDTQQAKALKQS